LLRVKSDYLLACDFGLKVGFILSPSVITKYLTATKAISINDRF
jgi:hypothetical protein